MLWRLPLAMVCLMGAPAGAAIRFELPQIQIPVSASSQVNGFIDVVVRADPFDLPALVSSLNVQFTVGGTQIVLEDAVSANNPLLPAGSVIDFSNNNQLARAAQDVFGLSPGSYPLSDGRGLIRVPFRVAIGATGVFPLTFGGINELSGPLGDQLPINTSDVGSISTFFSGDYNRDGSVDAADYTVWRDLLGTPTVSPFASADGDGDGLIDQDDYQIWKNGFGAPALALLSGSAAAVPESGSAALLLLGLLGSLALRVLPSRVSLLATSPIDGVRDGERAVTIAKKACELNNYQEASPIDTLAAAYAEAGDFDQAVKWSEKALEMAQDEPIRAARYAKHLESIKSHKPWRMPLEE